MLLVLAAIPTAALARDFPDYGRTYRALDRGHLRAAPGISGPEMVFFLPDGPVTGMRQYAIYYRRTRGMKLLGRGRIRGDALTHLSPYSLYWLVRLRAKAESLSPPQYIQNGKD